MIQIIQKNRDMKRHLIKKISWKKQCVSMGLLLTVLLFSSCARIDPGKVNIEFERTRPEPKITSYTEALIELGMMTEIYATDVLKVQSIPIFDNTGSSVSTGGEIPKDISEMVKSVLNCIGGNLIYIPYDPSFIQNQIVTGYSNFQYKLVPDVVISGGITEFDRGLETREKSTDVSSRLTYEGLPDYLPGLEKQVPYPSKEMEFKYDGGDKVGLARITLDFNLLNFQTMSGIPRMNTVNSIEVQKAASQKELGISIFAQAFGRKGKIKKVQGRHAAIRLLVELSMVQLIGRQLILPYWNLLGDEALPDRIVLDSATSFYQSLTENQKIAFTQQQLFLHGYDIPIDGRIDQKTVSALKDFFKTDLSPIPPDVDHFMKLWSSLPITKDTLKKRQALNAILQKNEEEQAAKEQAQQEQIAREQQQQEQAARKQQRRQQAAREQQQNAPAGSQSPSNTHRHEEPESKSVPEEAVKQEPEGKETVDQLLRMLEQKKRKRQASESIPRETIDRLLQILEEKKES